MMQNQLNGTITETETDHTMFSIVLHVTTLRTDA